MNEVTDQERIEYRYPAIRAMTDPCGIAAERISFIPGGKTNESYIVYADDGKKYLARIAGSGTEAFIDREKEMYNVAAADRIGVAPKLICARDNNLLLEYIEGVCTTSQEILFLNGNVDKLTKQLRDLHSAAEPFKGSFSFIHDFYVYKNDFLSTGYPTPPEMRAHEAELYEMTCWVDEKLTVDLCPVHSDIVLQNFIFADDRVYMIDWEYSTMSDKYLDLASFCTQNILGSGADRMFLKSYFGSSGEKLDYGKFLLFKMAISFMWIYWHLNNVAHNKDPQYNEYRWRMHLNNAVVCREDWERLERSPSLRDQAD